MGWVRTLVDEIVALFVDDVSLVVAILVWLGAVFAASMFHIARADILGPLLFVGLAAIFVENTLRRARK